MAGYGTDQGLTDFLAANGYSLPDGALDPAVLRQRGSAYLDASYGQRFIGTPVTYDQERSWPRTGATVYGTSIPVDEVPWQVVEASYHAAYIAATDPSALSVTVDPNARVKRSKVEGIEEEYFEPGAAAGGVLTASLSSDIEGLLSPLMTPAGGFPAVLVV